MTTETSAENGCYQCGSPEGAMTRLCPSCCDQNDAKRSTLQAKLHVDQGGTEDPLFFRLATLSPAHSGVVLLFFIGSLIVIMAIGAVVGIPAATLIVLCTILVLGTIFLGTGIAILTIAFRHHRPLALASLVFAPALYLFCGLAYKQRGHHSAWKEIKNVLIAHGAVGGMLLATFVGANAINVHIFDSRTYAPPKVVKSFR